VLRRPIGLSRPIGRLHHLLHPVGRLHHRVQRLAGPAQLDACDDLRDPEDQVEQAEQQRKGDRFGAGNLIEAVSPSNVPLVNPSSAKAVIDTGGLSLARGGLSLLRDMASPPRIPEMVDRSAFDVGRNIAVTPGEVVLRTEVLELIQYRLQTGQVREVPLLIVPPTINKFYALDLAPGRSMVEYLAQKLPRRPCPGRGIRLAAPR
jgi:hypothetical protein